MSVSASSRQIITSCAAVALAVLGGGGLSTIDSAAPAGTDVSSVQDADSWVTYHYDQRRQGYDPYASPASGSLTPAWQADLDGAVYAQPLVIGDTIIAVTENDSVYGLTLSGAVLWRTNLGSPVPRAELPCGNIDPLGITGTPIYHPATNQVYFVAELDDPIRHTLFAVDVDTGDVSWSRDVDPEGSTPTVQQQRGAMAIAKGRVWVSLGALAGDCGPYHGYEVGVRLDGSAGRSVYQTPSERGAGLWAPTGPSVDAQGHLFVAPANGAAFAPPYDDSDSIVKLDGNRKISLWAPTNWAEENEKDKGQGPAAPLLFSALGKRWAFSISKAPHVYLLRQGDLGGIGGQVVQREGCKAWAGMAFHDGLIYVPCVQGMTAYTITRGPRITKVWRTRATGYGAAPVVGGGAVWSSNAGTLWQLDPATGATVASIPIGVLPHFASPTLHGSLVLVGTMAGVSAVSTS